MVSAIASVIVFIPLTVSDYLEACFPFGNSKEAVFAVSTAPFSLWTYYCWDIRYAFIKMFETEPSFYRTVAIICA